MVISEQENSMILEIPSAYEVKNCVNKLHPLKSQGPDGFLESFYINYWRMVGAWVLRFVQECFKLKAIPHNINNTSFILILKTK